MRRPGAGGSWSTPAGPRSRAGPRPLTAAFLSSLLPGWGQYLLRRRRRGGVLLGVSLVGAALVIGVAGWLVVDGRALEVMGTVMTPGGLLVLMLANVAVAAFRLFVTMDAWAAARKQGAARGAVQVGGLSLVLVTLVALPHGAVGLAGAEARRVADAVFGGAEGTDAEAVAAPAEPAFPAGRAGDRESDEEVTAPDLAASDELLGPVREPDAPGVPEPLGGRDRLTVLMLGSDAGPGRSGTRVDTFVVASLDTTTGDVALVSVPRNIGDVPLPDGLLAERLGDAFPQRLMSLYPAAAADEVLGAEFDDPGKHAIRGAIETLLDLEIDHVAMVDLAGFVDVIDALGGVGVDVSDPIRVRLSPPREGEDWRTYDIPAGRQWLDGHEAHAYVRSRTGTDDYDRMRRQRCLVGSLAEESDTLTLLRALPALTDVLVERVETDMPVELLPDLARAAGRVDVAGLRGLGLTPPAYTDGSSSEGFYAPDVDAMREAVDALITGGDEPAEASSLASTCG